MKEENLIKYTCDVCGKNEYVKKGESSPTKEILLPMKYYDETGRQCGLTLQYVDVCPECLKLLVDDLLKHYDMRCVAYFGVEIKRHTSEKGGEG